MFQSMLKCNKAVQVADWLLCNSAYDLEPATFTFTPEILTIGPLLASRRLGNSAGYFWPQDSTCLEWLDQQPPNSVIYVAFGSFTIFKPTQFKNWLWLSNSRRGHFSGSCGQIALTRQVIPTRKDIQSE
ncbi:hypothetical protein ACFX2A_046301 [Malus domestica]